MYTENQWLFYTVPVWSPSCRSSGAHVQLQVILDASQLMRLARPWAKEAQQVVSPEPDEAQSSREGDAYEADSMAAKRRKRR